MPGRPRACIRRQQGRSAGSHCRESPSTGTAGRGFILRTAAPGLVRRRYVECSTPCTTVAAQSTGVTLFECGFRLGAPLAVSTKQGKCSFDQCHRGFSRSGQCSSQSLCKSFTICTTGCSSMSLTSAFYGRLLSDHSVSFRQAAMSNVKWIKWFNYCVRDADLPRYDPATTSRCDWVAVTIHLTM